MLLAVHDSQMRKVAFLDNAKQDTLSYSDDKWHRVLDTASSTFEFTVPKKNLEADTVFGKVYSHLNEKAYVSFKYRGRNFVFVVAKVEETYQSIRCTCLNLNLDMINSEVGPYKASKAMSFVEYCNALGLTTYKGFSIGINEISDKRLTLEWEGTDTKVKRLLSLANKFQAEIEFDVQFHDDSSIKAFVINVFKEGDGETNHGVGRIRKDKILRRGKDIKIIERTIDKTGIYNALTLKGKEGVRINDNSWKVLNDKGEVEFYQKGDTLYAPLSLQMYPSAFEDKETGEQWSKKTLEVDSNDPKKIRETGYRELKKLAYPAVTYAVKGGTDLDLGDTVRLQDNGFIPALTLEARVIEQIISFTKPSQNESVFGNFKALESRVSKDLMARLEEMVEAARPYTIKLEIDGGVIFKNHIGQTRVEATLYKGGKVVHDVNWSWSFGDVTSNSQDFLVEGSMVTDTKNLIVTALSQGREVAKEQLTFSNVFDGAIGKPGLAGADGRTPFIHTAWADSADGSQGFSTTVSTGKAYFGTCTTYSDTNPTGADPTDYRRYNWSKTKGDAGRGIVRTTHYFLATAQGSGVTASTSGWTTTAQYTSESKKYLWNYTVTEYSDNTSQTGVPIIIGTHGAKGDKGDRGNDGIAGRDGVGIRSTVVTYGISSSDTVQPSSWSSNVPTLVKGQYLWTKTVWTYTDNRTETGYQKTYISRDGNNGRDGIPGKDGVGIRSTVISYAVSTSGTSAPTVGWGEQVPNVPNGQYLWTRTIYTYTDNDTETAYSVSRMGNDGTGLLATWTFYKLSNSTTAPQVVPIGTSTNLSHLGPNNTWNSFTELSGRDTGWNVIDFDKIAKSDIIPDKPFTWYLEASFDGVSNFNGSTSFNIKFENYYFNSAGSRVYNPLGTRDHTASNFSATNSTSVNNYFSQSITWTVPRAVYDAIPEGGFLNLRIRIDRFTKLYYHTKNSYVTYGTIPSNAAQRGLGNYSTYGWKPVPQTVTPTLPYLWMYQIQFFDNGTEKAMTPVIIGSHGLQGLQGPKGDQGIPGAKGADGRTQYTHIAYADNDKGAGFSQTDQTKAYIGMYQDFTATDSTNPASYRWTKWKGDKGDTGAQGVPGPKGADGRTVYIHFAYSDNADGTGLTTSDNGQRYIGHYSDYTQADSTDKTKYRWADRWAKIEVGGRNYAEDYDFNRGMWEYSQGDASVKSIDFTNGIYTVTTSTNTWHQLQIHSESGGRLGGKLDSNALLDLEVGETYTLSVEVKVNSGSPKFWLELRDNGIANYNAVVTHLGGSSTAITATSEWVRYSVTGTIKPNSDFGNRRIILGYNEIGSISFRKVELTRGIAFTDSGRAPEDTDAQFEAVNQRMREEAEQQAYELTKLQEQAQSIRVELEAKALASEIKQWLAEYKEFAQSTDKTIEDFTRSFFKSQERIVEMEKTLGENSLMLNFVNNYLRASEDGVTLGNKDNTEYIQITPQGIQLMSAGVAVATIANGLMKTAHGVLTDSLQVGKFRFEQSKRNPDVNVWRYVE